MSTYYRHLIESGLLLDQYPNAAVAYSLRKLREGYTRVFNLWSYSEELQQSVWTKTNLTVTADAVVAPDGLTTGDILYETVDNGNHNLTRNFSVVGGQDYVVSFYVNAQGRDFLFFRSVANLSTNGATAPNCWVDLSSGTVVSQNGFFRVAPTITAVGGGWFKIEYGLIASATLSSVALSLFTSPDGSNLTYVGDVTKGVAVWGIQITQSSTVLPYEKTVVTPDNGSAIRVRRTSNSAELDIPFDSSGELDTATLLNFVGYNLWSYSEEMQQGVWGKTSVTSTTDTVIAPNGNTTGDVILETIASGTHTISRTQVVLAGEEYTISFWVRPEGRNFISIRSAINLSTNNISQPVAFFDLTTGTKISDNGLFRLAPTITAAPNGWFFITYGVIVNSSTTSTALQLNLSTDGTTTSYVGNPLLGVGVWGIQITKSSTVKPYRQTLAVAEGQGFITTWYDQSGNGNNAIQTTAANQAEVVRNSSMIIDTLTNKPTTSWTSDRYTLLSNISTNTKYFLSVVWKRASLINLMPTLGSSSTPLYWYSSGFGNDVRSIMNTGVSHGASTTLLTNNIISLKNNANLAVVYQNSVALPNTGTIAPSAGTINTWGQQSTNIFYSGEYQEMIYWDSEQSNNKNGIEQNTNDYYGIY